MNSKILLVKNIHIDRQYTNVLSYSEAQMLELCQANLVAQADNYSFLRPTGSIMAGFTYAQCLQANYIAFQNPDYSNKWFFAWIDDVIYKGDKNTEITFTVDAWSTWFDKWQKKTCFINRQHTNDDTIGLNTVPENLDVGEMVLGNWNIYNGLAENYYFCLMSTYDIITNDDFVGVEQINGNLFGYIVYIFNATNTAIVALEKVLAEINKAGKIESILALFVAPADLIDSIGKRKLSSYDGTYVLDTSQILSNDAIKNAVHIDYDIQKPYSFSDYQPKNNKCYVYPYNYLLVTNNIGNQIIYKYEDFYENPIHFDIQIALSIGCSGRLVPRNYKKVDYNNDESIPLAKYPTCSWATDAFTNWLTQNAVNIGTQLVSAGVGVASGNIPTVAGNIASLIGQFYQASLMPSIEGGQNTGDVNYSVKNNTFNFYNYHCKPEYMKIIDDYFTRFGYAVKSLAMPNIAGRRYWNYVEIGASEEIGYGEVPSKFMDTINNACRRGVTIWHNHANVGNYNLSNNIT